MTSSKKHRIFITAVLLALLAAILAGGIFGTYALHRYNTLEMPMPYTNKSMAYTATNENAMETQAAFSFSLCVGDANVGNSNITVEDGVSAGLFNLDNKSVLFSKNMYSKVYPASLTKIVTAILALKYGNLDDVVTINWQDLELESGSQVVGFKIGDQVTMRELLHGLLVHSGNDAALAIARHVGGSVSKFVTMMNDELKEIGATNSHFMNPTGLQDTNHYTTVYDIYLMLNNAITYPDFVSIMQISVYELNYTDASGQAKKVTLDSTDHYLTKDTDPPKDVTVLGGKTGTTDDAGNCLAIVSQNAFGQPFISVVVGASSKDVLYTNMNSLLSQINA